MTTIMAHYLMGNNSPLKVILLLLYIYCVTWGDIHNIMDKVKSEKRIHNIIKKFYVHT